jgi:hypothetical protein
MMENWQLKALTLVIDDFLTDQVEDFAHGKPMKRCINGFNSKKIELNENRQLNTCKLVGHE